MQRIEHYEIAAYGTDMPGKSAGRERAGQLLTLTLGEEKQTDLVTEQHIIPAAISEDETGEEPAGRKKAAAARSKAA
jgi:ferritin-like metal-binding protein YciE